MILNMIVPLTIADVPVTLCHLRSTGEESK